ncbi:MAG: tetratricopeptide repeat protein [Anaerolineae bacterium]
MSEQQQRAMPIIALLVILISSIVIVIMSNRSSISDDAPQPTVTQPETTAIPSSPAQSTFSNEREPLMIALYRLEAESARAGWTAQAHIRAGNLWRDMGDLGRALPHWESANADTDNANLIRQIADIYIERGEWGIAWQRIQTLLALAPTDAWALYHGGLILAPSDPFTAYGYLGQVAEGNTAYADTARILRDVIGEQSGSADMILQIGATLASAEEWSLAENSYQYAADVYYPFPEATAYVGVMRILQGKNGEAWITEALALADDNSEVHYLAGIYWRSAGEYARSEAQLVQAVLLEPENPTFHAELGNTYRTMGNMLDAEIWLQTAVRVSDEDPLMVEALNDFYTNEAILNTQPIIRDAHNLADGQDASVIAANAWALYLQDESETALTLIEQALRIDPTNARTLFDQARILLGLGRNEEAQAILEQLASGQSAFAGAAADILAQTGGE